MALHPILPAGYNEDPIDGDDVDGAGTNETVWPHFFDTFTMMHLFIIDQDMLDIFETGCPDYVIPCGSNTIVFPAEFRELVIRRRA